MYMHGLYKYGFLDCQNLINFDISCDGIMDCKYEEDKSHLWWIFEFVEKKNLICDGSIDCL